MPRILVTLLLVVLSVGAARGARAADEPMPVVATFSVLADMLVNVGGDHIVVKTIVGPGADCCIVRPHRRRA